jgi:hypothetical protein
MQSLNQMQGGRMLFAQGAVPIVRDGAVEGAVGVSGAAGAAVVTLLDGSRGGDTIVCGWCAAT